MQLLSYVFSLKYRLPRAGIIIALIASMCLVDSQYSFDGQSGSLAYGASRSQVDVPPSNDARTNFLPLVAAVYTQLNLDAGSLTETDFRQSDEPEGIRSSSSVMIYDEEFALGWGRRWPWSLDVVPGRHSMYKSGEQSLAMTFTQPWGGYQILTDDSVSQSEFKAVEFWIHGGYDGVSQVSMTAMDMQWQWGNLVPLNVPANTWSRIQIPLAEFKISGPIQGFVLHQRGGIVTGSATFYLDALALLTELESQKPIDRPGPTPEKTATPNPTATPAPVVTAVPTALPTVQPTAQPTAAPPSQPPADGPKSVCGAMMMGVNLPSLNHGYGADFATVESWNNYHTYNGEDARAMMAELASNGANSIRWWVFLDGRGAPEFDNRGYPTGFDDTTLPSMADALVAAGEHGIIINFSLWSFEMLGHQGIGDTPNSGSHGELFYDDKAFEAYAKNVLIPMANYPTVDGYTIATHPNVMWEILNEPEWALHDTDQPPNAEIEDTISTPQLQKFVAKNVGILHRQGAKMVGVGQAALKFIANSRQVPGAWGNLYEDHLLEAYDADGAIDYYSPHYYDWMDGDGSTWNYNPYDYTKAQLGIDKPIIIGEISAKTADREFDLVKSQGYDGAWIWTYDGIDARGSWNDAKTAFQKFKNNHPSAYGWACDGE